MNKFSTHAFEKIKVVWFPPKPNELESTWLISLASIVVVALCSSLKGLEIFSDGRTQLFWSDRTEYIASIAPDAPKVCPVNVKK